MNHEHSEKAVQRKNPFPNDRWGGMPPKSSKIFLIIFFIVMVSICVIPTLLNDFVFSEIDNISSDQIDRFVIGESTIDDKPTIDDFLSTTDGWESFFFSRPRFDEKYRLTIKTDQGRTRQFILYVRHNFEDVIVQHVPIYPGGVGNDARVSTQLYSWINSNEWILQNDAE